jgi:hypothetical protein
MDLEPVAELELSDPSHPDPGLVTGGDISVDGRWILLRTDDTAYVWRRDLGQSVTSAFDRTPCRAPLRKERQGEAIAWAASGMGFFTVSEGKREPIYYYGLIR